MNRSLAINTNVDVQQYHKNPKNHSTGIELDSNTSFQDVLNKWDKTKGNKEKTLDKLGEYFEFLRSQQK